MRRANRIRELRLEKGITQVRLSMELGVTQETISAYEVGKHLPSLTTLMKLSELFNASMDYIMNRSDVRNPVKEGSLNSDETRIITYYRTFDKTEQLRSLAYIQGLSDSHK